MTAVVALVDLPSTGSVSDASAARIPLAAGPGPSVQDACSALSDILDQAGTVVCVYPAWQEHPAERVIRFARAAVRTHRIVGVPSKLPPLAMSLTVDLLAYLVRYVPPGILVAMASRLESMMVAGAWLSSVTRLQHAPATLRDHIGSYVPGSAFLTLISPVTAVVRQPPNGELPCQPGDPVQLLTAAEGCDEKWVRRHPVPVARVAVHRALPPQPLSAAYWHNRRYLEFVAFSGHPEYLTQAVRSIRYRPCAWCGELVTADPCPFCRMSAAGAAFRPSQTLPESQQLPQGAPLVANGAASTVEIRSDAG